MSEFNVQAINQEMTPIGTVQEAEAEGLSPAEYATCARPNPSAGIIGCPRFAECVVSAKGSSGPRNYGIQIFKGKAQGGAMVNTTASCLWIAAHAATIEKNGGAVKVIAEEGESYPKVTGMAVDDITGKPTMNVRMPGTHRDDVRVDVPVTPWPRPGQNPELLNDVLRAEMSEIERKRRSDESLARNIGAEHTIAPLDKRDAGQAQGRSKAGK